MVVFVSGAVRRGSWENCASLHGAPVGVHLSPAFYCKRKFRLIAMFRGIACLFIFHHLPKFILNFMVKNMCSGVDCGVLQTARDEVQGGEQERWHHFSFTVAGLDHGLITEKTKTCTAMTGRSG